MGLMWPFLLMYGSHDVTPRFPVRPDWRIRIGFRGTRPNWDSLPDFFSKPNLYLWVWPTSYNIIKISYTYQKNYHWSGVYQNLYTFIESHLQIQNCTFTFTNQSTKPTCSEPLQVCWPSCMRMFSDVFSCTYMD